MTAERFTVKRTKEGGAIVLLDGHRMTSNDSWTADQWNDWAIMWHTNDRGGRATDTALLAAQYLYSGDFEVWADVRPTCTQGSIGAGFCTNETEPGTIFCSIHSDVMSIDDGFGYGL